MSKIPYPIIIGLLLLSSPAFAEGDAANGAKVFKKCAACHAVGDGAKNKLGPILNGIVGRPAATYDGFKYSKALKAKGDEGLVWDEASLTAYIQNPKEFIKGTRMSFAGIKNDEQITDLIAYLKTFQ